MLATQLNMTSKITSKGQLTMPKPVRDVLGVGEGEHVRFVVDGGVVTVESANIGHEDPAIGQFLSLIEKDIAEGRNLHADLPGDVVAAMQHAIENIEVDLDEEVTDDVSL